MLNIEFKPLSMLNSGLQADLHSLQQEGVINFKLIFVCLQMVQAFTHGPVKLEAQKGGTFELFGGNISGVFVELVRKGSKLCDMRQEITEQVGLGVDISDHI
jgi:hypothetical protein